MLNTFVRDSLIFIAVLFVVVIGTLVLTAITMYIIDVRQTQSTIRRNYPVIGRFRYLFEHLGNFFRQYFFALDREELPFNRALRNWIYRAAKNVTTNIGFGSSRHLNTPGEPHFLNSAFPVLETDAQAAPNLVFGPDCRKPFAAKSFFNISAMSYGSLSRPAITALSRGAARANCWLNTGEGGLSPHHLVGGGDIVFQIGTAKYGVRDKDGNLCETRLAELAQKPQVKMFEIKLSQGAKPGKGGILPKAKVSREIAVIRGIAEGEDSISPNRHTDVANTSELLDLVHKVKTITGKPVGLKFVLGQPKWLEELCQAITTQGPAYTPDFITLDSADGGTGAAPQPLMDFVGLPLKESLPMLLAALHKYNLKEPIKVIASGKLVTPSSVALALAEGADAVVSARGFMFALGCIQAMQCHENTCPTGITTHDVRFQKGLDPANKAARVANYHKQVVHDVNTIAHSCGAEHARELSLDHVRLVDGDGTSQVIARSNG